MFLSWLPKWTQGSEKGGETVGGNFVLFSLLVNCGGRPARFVGLPAQKLGTIESIAPAQRACL